jgi:hypothetical protein
MRRFAGFIHSQNTTLNEAIRERVEANWPSLHTQKGEWVTASGKINGFIISRKALRLLFYWL